MSDRVLLISPVRNEAPYIAQTVQGVADQERPPDAWVIVDDGSTDGTDTILAEVTADLPFVRVVQTPQGYTEGEDRNAAGGPDRAWNFGLEQVDPTEFTHVGKLDGDTVLPPDYIRVLLERFRADPALGMAAGTVTELRGGEWWVMPTPKDHVTPQARLYTRTCFEAIGGMPRYMGADMITTFYAKMRGFKTLTYEDLPYKHLRPMGTAQGARRGHQRHGAYQYVIHYGFFWMLLRSLAVAVRFRPYGLSGIWLLSGYVKAVIGRRERIEDPEFIAFAKAEQRRRMRDSLRRIPAKLGLARG